MELFGAHPSPRAPGTTDSIPGVASTVRAAVVAVVPAVGHHPVKNHLHRKDSAVVEVVEVVAVAAVSDRVLQKGFLVVEAAAAAAAFHLGYHQTSPPQASAALVHPPMLLQTGQSQSAAVAAVAFARRAAFAA